MDLYCLEFSPEGPDEHIHIRGCRIITLRGSNVALVFLMSMKTSS